MNDNWNHNYQPPPSPQKPQTPQTPQIPQTPRPPRVPVTPQYPYMQTRPPQSQLPMQYRSPQPPQSLRTPVNPPQKHRPGAGVKALLVAFCFILAIAAGFVGGYIANMNRPVEDDPKMNMTASQQREEQQAGIPTPAFEITAPEQEAFSSSSLISAPGGQAMTTPEVAAAVRQSVVEIKTETITAGSWTGTYVSEGAGSGVIVSEDGYIVTNDHVINGASSISVRLVDGREFPASLVATDSRADIAVIKISASGLMPASFGDSSTLVIGESVIAVGNPLGELGGSVTGGIISALDREMIVEGETMTLLQTDAAVNPGNSGGGLFNMRAELIGIVNAKSSGLNVEGLGFAIPASIARAVANDLISHGYVRGRIDTGLELVDIQTAQAVRWYRVSQTGLYIVNSADERLKNGDRITTVNGKQVENLFDYNEAIKGLGVGDKVNIIVSRGNSAYSAEITLAEWKP